MNNSVKKLNKFTNEIISKIISPWNHHQNYSNFHSKYQLNQLKHLNHLNKLNNTSIRMYHFQGKINDSLLKFKFKELDNKNLNHFQKKILIFRSYSGNASHKTQKVISQHLKSTQLYKNSQFYKKSSQLCKGFFQFFYKKSSQHKHGNSFTTFYVIESNTTVHFIIILVIIFAFLLTMEKPPTKNEVYGTMSHLDSDGLLLWSSEGAPFQNFRSDYTVVKKFVNTTGAVVYLVGTNHADRYCADDLIYVVDQVKPDASLIELCPSRTAFLRDTSRYIGYDVRALYKASQKLDIPCIFADQNFGVTFGELGLENISNEYNTPNNNSNDFQDYGVVYSTEAAFDAVIRNERDIYLARSILASLTFPNVKTIVVQVGAAHVPGIEHYLTTLTTDEGKKLTSSYEESWSLRLSNVKFRELQHNLFFIENRSIGDSKRLIRLRERFADLIKSTTNPEEISLYQGNLAKVDAEIERARKSRKSLEL